MQATTTTSPPFAPAETMYIPPPITIPAITTTTTIPATIPATTTTTTMYIPQTTKPKPNCPPITDQGMCNNTDGCVYTSGTCWSTDNINTFGDVVSNKLQGTLVPITINTVNQYYLTLAGSTDPFNFLIKKISINKDCNELDPSCNFLLSSNITLSPESNDLLKYYMVLYNGKIVQNLTQYPVFSSNQVAAIKGNSNIIILTATNNTYRTVNVAIVDNPNPTNMGLGNTNINVIDKDIIDQTVQKILQSSAVIKAL